MGSRSCCDRLSGLLFPVHFCLPWFQRRKPTAKGLCLDSTDPQTKCDDDTNAWEELNHEEKCENSNQLTMIHKFRWFHRSASTKGIMCQRGVSMQWCTTVVHFTSAGGKKTLWPATFWRFPNLAILSFQRIISCRNQFGFGITPKTTTALFQIVLHAVRIQLNLTILPMVFL